MAVTLERPAARHLTAFVAAARRSRRLHAALVSPPRDAEAYRAYLRGCRRANREPYLIVDDGDLVGAASLNEIVRGAFQSAYLGYYAFAPHAGKGLGYFKVSGRWRDHERHALLAPEWKRHKRRGSGAG